MNYIEAITFLENYLDSDIYTKKCYDSHRMAISAMEKQIPKKQTDTIFNPVIKCKMGNCPNCCEYLNENEYDYCPKCGQAIDWSDTNG